MEVPHLQTVPEVQVLNNEKISSPDLMSPPSPIITRRTRRDSLSERAAKGALQHGMVKYFCRQRGHGFITPKDGSDDIFVHVSDIEGEFVPHEGDTVTYKICPVPPKFERMQAVHVRIMNLAPGERHERWDQPPSPHKEAPLNYTRLLVKLIAILEAECLESINRLNLFMSGLSW